MTALLLTGTVTAAGAADAVAGSVEALAVAELADGVAPAEAAASLVGVLGLDSAPSRAGNSTEAV